MPSGKARRALTWMLVVLIAIAVGGQAVIRPQLAVAGEVAHERARILDALFLSLRAARGEAEADVIVAEIWKAWMSSGRPEVDRVLNEGISYLALGLYASARDRFSQAIEAAPDFAEAWNKRARVLYLMNEYDRSLDDIEKVMALEPRHFGALAGRATIHAHAGRWKEALAAFRAALAVNPFLKERQTVLPDLERRVEGERL